MYDMYPWDSASQGDYPPEPLRSRRAQKTRDASPARAVQIALDRRDNGGDAASAHTAAAPRAAAASRAAAAAPHAAAPPAASAHAASAHATPPTASRTRQ